MFKISKCTRAIPKIYPKKPVETQQKTIKFPNRYISLIVPSVLEQTNCPAFKVPMEMTKIEIKNYLETFYGLRVDKVHTSIVKGRTKRLVKRGSFGKVKVSDFKKAYVYLKEYVSIPWKQEIKNEILRYYDRRYNKKLKEEAAKKKIREMQQQQAQAQAQTPTETSEQKN